MVVERSLLLNARWFLLACRPAVTVGCLAAYCALWLAGYDDAATRRMMLLFTVAALLGVPYLMLAGRRGYLSAARLAIFPDAVMVGLLIWGTGVPHMVTIGYLWPVAVASYFCSTRIAAACFALSTGIALVVLELSNAQLPASVFVSNLLGLLALGSLIVFIGASLRRHESVMSLQVAADQATLELASEQLSSTDGDRPLSRFVEQLGRAVGADRSLLRVFGREDMQERVVEWTADGVTPQGDVPLSELAVGPVMRGEPVSMSSRDEIVDPLQRRQLEQLDIGSGVGMPIVWEGMVVGLLSLQSRASRDWTVDVLPVLRRLAPTVGTILVQQQVVENQQRSLATLRELSRLRERLVATTSHELRTPLTVVRGYFDLVDRDGMDLPPERMQELHRAAVSSTERLVRITDDLLELNRLHRDQPSLRMATVDLRDLVSEAVRESCGGAETACELPEGLVLQADRDRLQQAFDNLLANACKYGRGRVGVEATVLDAAVEVAITDDGEGVAFEHRSELFTPFASFGGHPDSTGLGLAVTRAIVEAHRGTVRYRPAAGSQPHAFVVRLPLEAAPSASALGARGRTR